MTRPPLDPDKPGIVTGQLLKQAALEKIQREGRSKTVRQMSGGIINTQGQFEVGQEGWGLLTLMWPKPGMALLPVKALPSMLLSWRWRGVVISWLPELHILHSYPDFRCNFVTLSPFATKVTETDEAGSQIFS